jgi:valyl-tRNA synthetase
VRFVPESWSKTYFQWMHNIQDWCISRQLWWGHQIPAWYDDQGNVYVARTEAEAREQARGKHGNDVALKRDEDVLDTWFSSALWPFSTLGWPQQTAELQSFYPTSVLVTGFDIIFFWVARMIMMGMKFTGDVPFREVYITGLIRDENGDKMSKSKGNIIDPIDLIDGIDLEALVAKRTSGMMQPKLKGKIERDTRKQFPEGIPAYGADALRFTLAALATMGRDIRFDLGRIEGYRNFCNKLWNAANYVSMNTQGQDCGFGDKSLEYSTADRWIRSRLGATVEEVNRQFAEYRFDLAAQALYEFAWYEYCDWYLELSKPTLQSTSLGEAQKRATRQTLVTVLETSLRLLHPLMPFITEEIWQSVARLANRGGPTIMLQAYPVSTDFPRDADAERAIVPIKATILGARQIRGQLNVARSREMPVYVKTPTAQDWTLIEANAELIRALGNITEMTAIGDTTELPLTAMQMVDGFVIHAPLAMLIDDPDAELVRLAKRKQKTHAELGKAEAKLGNQNFVANAPPEVVEQERGRIAEFQREIEQIAEQERRVAELKKPPGSPQA